MKYVIIFLFAVLCLAGCESKPKHPVQRKGCHCIDYCECPGLCECTQATETRSAFKCERACTCHFPEKRYKGK